MENQEIQKILEYLENSNLASLELQIGDTFIKAKKPCCYNTVATVVAQSPVETQVTTEPKTEQEEISEENILKAPLVGIVYLSPNPYEPKYINEGDTVKKGQVLCIIEAMKVFNEITAHKDGVIQKVCVESEKPVAFGESLFIIK